MYVDFKEEKTTQSGFGSGLLWMLSGVMMGLLAGLAMYYFANRSISNVEAASPSLMNLSEETTEVKNTSINKSTFAKDKEVISPFGASKDADDPEELLVASLIDKNYKEEIKERPSFSYYAVLPDLNVPIQTIHNPSEKEIREQKEKEEQKKRAQLTIKEGVEKNTAKENSQEEAHATKSTGKSAYLFQVASYRKRHQADRTRGRLRGKGMRSYVEKRNIKGKTWFRVMAGPVESNKLKNWKASIASLGHKPLIFPAK